MDEKMSLNSRFNVVEICFCDLQAPLIKKFYWFKTAKVVDSLRKFEKRRNFRRVLAIFLTDSNNSVTLSLMVKVDGED